MTEKQAVFFSRSASTVVLWGLVLASILNGWELGFLAIVGGFGLLGLWEFYMMLDAKGLPKFRFIGMFCGAVLMLGSFTFYRRSESAPGHDFEIATLLGFMLVVFARQMFRKTRDISPLEAMAYTIFGLLYVPWLFSFVTKIVYLFPRDVTGHITGNWYVLFLLVVTKFSDMGAYLTGSLIGRHPLIPHISPKKTVEGFAGALAFSVGGAHALRWLLGEKLGALSALDATVLGLGLGFAAVIGDLAESIVKRTCDVKDSGKFLPGIGGALDLIDSLLFTGPLLFFYLRFVAGVK